MALSLILANLFVFSGAIILFTAIFSTYKLLQRLPPGKIHRSWNLLMGLTLFFIVGYVAYGLVFLGFNREKVDLIVPTIFLSGSVFVLLSSILSLQTAIDVRRVTMLEQENVTDPLTGIFNRRYMDRRLHEEFARAARFHQPLSILLIDIDHFKAINDAYGHPSGDQALISFTKLIMNSIRASDVVSRYGGDEFMVIAINTPGTEAYQLAERIRKIAETHVLEMVDERKRHYSVRVTISIGVACYSEKYESIQAFIECADQMMYKAKNEGRNRTVFGEDYIHSREKSHQKDSLFPAFEESL